MASSLGVYIGRTERPLDDERTQFDAFIEEYRSAIEVTLDCLTEEQARRQLVSSATTLLGLSGGSGCARTARNPSTGAPLQLAATRTVGFKVGATFKQEVADSVTAKTPTKVAAKKTPAKATTSKSTAAEKAAKK